MRPNQLLWPLAGPVPGLSIATLCVTRVLLGGMLFAVAADAADVTRPATTQTA